MNRAKIIMTLATLLLASISALAQTSGKSPASITDPAQITSKQKFDVQPLTVEKLYMTHTIGDST